jgi:HK97 family phage portal protein
MSFLTQLFERRSIEGRTVINGTTLLELFGGTASTTGKVVTPSTALQLVAVYACISLLSETFASLPAILYRRLRRGKERATEHPLYRVLHDVSNPEQTSVDFRSMMMAYVLLYGHAYAEISRNGAGEVKELWPLIPTQVTAVRNKRNELVYQVSLSDGTIHNLAASRVLHVSGMLGLSPIGQAREALGLTMATEEYGARFFGNDSRPGGVLEHPGQLSPAASERIRKSYEASMGGLSNRHRMMVLEEGMKWTQIGLPNEDSQFLETRKFQVEEIARLFRVPPHMIGDVDRSTSWGTGIEQQNIGFITYSLRSWLVRWEQEINKTLLSEDEQGQYFVEFLVDGLLRGDAQSRYTAYATARQNGWMNGNEIRELENMNPAEGLDVYLVNGNMKSADQANEPPAQPSPPAPPPEGEESEEEEVSGDEE